VTHFPTDGLGRQSDWAALKYAHLLWSSLIGQFAVPMLDGDGIHPKPPDNIAWGQYQLEKSMNNPTQHNPPNNGDQSQPACETEPCWEAEGLGEKLLFTLSRCQHMAYVAIPHGEVMCEWSSPVMESTDLIQQAHSSSSGKCAPLATQPADMQFPRLRNQRENEFNRVVCMLEELRANPHSQHAVVWRVAGESQTRFDWGLALSRERALGNLEMAFTLTIHEWLISMFPSTKDACWCC